MTAITPEQAARLERVRAHIAAAREPRAAGPGADATSLRTAYLDLLKLCVCDLAGVATTSVGAQEDGTVLSRELQGEARKMRAAGLDWPLHGLTMVGLGRLDDLQGCLESVVAKGVAGDVIEAGSWRGGASILARATLDSLGDARTVWVADSFAGFPDGDDDLGRYDFLAAPLAEVQDSFARLGLDRGVQFVPGFFEQSLAPLIGLRWAIVRLDADTYEATREALRCLYPGLVAGGYLIVDDYGSFEGCRRAVDEFRAEHGITEPLHEVDSTCVRWQRTDDAPIDAGPPAVTEVPALRERDPHGHVPTHHEVALRQEIEALHARLAAAEAQVGLRPWLRRKAGR
jgi:O-methyltransferase